MINSNYYNQRNPVLAHQPVPDSTRFVMEQQYNAMANQQLYQQAQTSDPYSEGSSILNSCSDVIRQKIMHDERYLAADNQCEVLIKQYLYSACINNILASKDGRIAFEQWAATIKHLKDEFGKEEMAKAQLTDALLGDPVVQKRLKELQEGRVATSE